MLRALPKNRFSSDYILIENDNVVASVYFSAWREAGRLSIGDTNYRVYREGALGGAFVLVADNSLLARAEKPSALYRSFTIAHGEKKYVLEAESAMRRKFVLREEGKPIGAIAPEHAWTRQAVADFPERIPLSIKAFMFWLVTILWRRE